MADSAIRDPLSGKLVAEYQHDSEDRFIAAVSAAREAQPEWARRPVRERARIVARLSRAISERQHELAALISRCTGKTRADAIAGEVAPIGMAAAWYARAARRVMRPRRLRRGHPFFFLIKRSYLMREPRGVIGIISPWNYPFGIPMHELMMAVVTGNAVVLKVATQVQPVGEVMVELLHSVGIPTGVVSVVHLPGREAGDAFLGAAIDKLMFTGSVAVGKQLAEGAGRRLLPVGLELGGNDAMLVLSDAPLERAVGGAVWAGLSNAGQSCGGVERIIVEAPIYERFREALAERVRGLRVGPDIEHNTDVGGLTTASQAETVRAHLADAIAKGAEIVAQSPPAGFADPAGSKRQAGSDHRDRPDSPVGCHPVILLENVTAEMDLVRHETFGPLLALERAIDEDDMIARANDSDLGLSASVWSTNRGRARRVAARVEAGSIAINDHLMQHGMAETPWGGYKESSIGRTHGILGLESMTRPKVVVESRWKRAPHQIWWHPNGPRAYRVITSILGVLYGPHRVRSAATLIPAFLSSLFTRPREQ